MRLTREVSAEKFLCEAEVHAAATVFDIVAAVATDAVMVVGAVVVAAIVVAVGCCLAYIAQWLS